MKILFYFLKIKDIFDDIMIICLCFHIVWKLGRCKNKATLYIIHLKLHGISECLGILDNSQCSKCEYLLNFFANN